MNRQVLINMMTKELRQESRTRRQKEAAIKWGHASEYGAPRDMMGTLHHPTGMGKTYTAVNFIAKTYLRKGYGERVTVLVPRKSLESQWIAEIQRHAAEYQDAFLVTTVQYLIHHEDEFKTDLLIVDELHMFYENIEDDFRSSRRSFHEYANGTYIKFKHNLGLTATPAKSNNAKLKGLYPIIDKVSKEEAQRHGWISRSIEYNLVLELNDQDLAKYMKMTDQITRGVAKFGKGGFGVAQKCLSGGYSAKKGKFYKGFLWALALAKGNGWFKGCSDEVDDLWNPKKIIGYAKNLMQDVRKRKDFLYEHPDKINALLKIIKKFRGVPLISFSESINFADKVYQACKQEGIDDVAVYHSQIESRPLIDKNTGEYIKYKSGKKQGQPRMFGSTLLKRHALEGIKNGDITVLSTARALDVGFDAQNLRIAVTSSASSKSKQRTQRHGRARRVNSLDPTEKVLLINIVFEHTKDMDWLEAATSKFDEVHYVYDVDDISFDEPDNTFTV